MATRPRDFYLDVMLGRYSGYEGRFVTGVITGQDIADGRDTVWDQGGEIQFLSAETELFASSSSVSDTACVAIVSGVDGNYHQKITTTVLTGQAQVSVGTFLVVEAVTINTVAAVGDVYIAESDTLTGGVPNTTSKIQSKVIVGNNVTRNGWWVVPEGKIGVILAIRATTDAYNKSAKIFPYVHRFGNTTIQTVEYAVTTGSLSGFEFPIPLLSFNSAGQLTPYLPEKTIHETRTEVLQNATNVLVGQEILLINKDELK